MGERWGGGGGGIGGIGSGGGGIAAAPLWIVTTAPAPMSPKTTPLLSVASDGLQVGGKHRDSTRRFFGG